LIVTTVFIVTGCDLFESDKEHAGGSTTTDNAIVAAEIRNPDGSPAIKAIVRLRPADYLSSTKHLVPVKRSAVALTKMDTETDSEGSFSIDSLEPGSYFIEVISKEFAEDSLTLLLKVEIEEPDESLEITPKKLKKTGIITGTVALPPGDAEFWVQVYGLERLVEVDGETGSFKTAVPGGIYDLYVISMDESISPVTVVDVAVGTGEQTDAGSIHPGYTVPETRDTTVSGSIADSKGNPASGVVVKLVPDNFNPVTDALAEDLLVITSSAGEYVFNHVGPGNYRIEALHLNDGSLLITDLFEVSGDSITLPEDTLDQPGTLALYLPDSIVVSAGNVYIPGTGIRAEVGDADLTRGYIILDAVPAGEFNEVLFAATSGGSAAMLAVDVAVSSGETTTISPYQAWEHSFKVSVNTTPDGADVTEDIVNFPLLVRLNKSSSSSTSPFEQAQGDGSDIRFTKSNQLVPLPFEIERWDPDSGIAEIWVKVDTVYGNNGTQHIYLYTGNPAERGPSAGNGATVFDTEDGFTAVWHLGEQGSDDPGGYGEATANEIYATGHSMVPESPVEGMIGFAQYFDGHNDYITAPDDPVFDFGTGDFTVSAFARADSLDTNDQIVCKKQDGNFEIEFADGKLSAYATSGGSGDEMQGSDTVETGKWYHTVLSRKSGVCNLYLNGVQDKKTFLCPTSVTSVSDVFLARDSRVQRRFFHGAIDEVRISGVGRSAAWIKLCFQNQRKNSTMISIE